MYIVFGILVGAVIGILAPITIPSQYSHYAAIAILGALDSFFGGINAISRNKFQLRTFLAGFFGNALIGCVMTFIGKQLDLDLFLAAVVVFGTRLFQNFADMLRFLLTNGKKTYKIRSDENQNSLKE